MVERRSSRNVVEQAPSYPDEVPLFGGARARRLRLRRRLLIAGAVVLTPLLIAGSVFVVTQRNVTTAVDLDRAVADFRTSRARPAEAAPERAVTESVGRVPGLLAEGREPMPPADAAVPDAAVASYVLPEEGVYAYRATGGERVSMLGASHTYPERVYASVRHLGGCHWEHRNQVIKEHVDIRTFCGEPGRLVQLAQERQVEFFKQREGGRYECEPALTLHETGDTVGRTRTVDCDDGKGSTSRLEAAFVAMEEIQVGTRIVEALVVEITGTMSGRVEGESFDALWLDATTGMTLRWERSVDTMAAAFGTRVRYTEEATFALESLDPQR